MVSSINKLLHFEGLRGLAAVIVVIHHFLLAFLPAMHTGNPSESHFQNSAAESFIAASPLSILFSGNLAVCVFFALSGYVLSKRFFDTGKRSAIASMAVKRYPRLIIPIAVSSLIALILLFAHIIPWQSECFTKSWWLCSLWPTAPETLHFLKTTFINVPSHGSADYNTVLWTMEYEFKGSILVAALCLLVSFFSGGRVIIYAVSAVLCLAAREFYYLNFIAGAAFCDPQLKIELRKARKIISFVLLAAAIIAGSYPALEFAAWDKFWFPFLKLGFLDPEQNMALWHSLSAISILFLLLNSAGAQKFFAKDIFVYLGKISFSVYLLHVLLIGALCMPIMYWLSQTLALNYLVSTAVSFALYLFALFPLSNVFYLWVDRQSIKIAAYISARFLPK